MLKINIILSVFVCLMPLVVCSQCGTNLVYNPSFEELSKCPTNANQVPFATGWVNPTYGSPELYNKCDTLSPYIWPNISGAFQFPKTGNGYAAIFTLDLQGVNLREYIQGKLSSPLTDGKKYCVSFYVSLANDFQYAVSGMGAYLSKTAIALTTQLNFTYTPQIENPKGNILTDTMNWIQIKGCFIAEGGEQYITIGNYRTDGESDTLEVNPTAIQHGGSYYLIDDVSVTECNDTAAINVPNVFTPNADGKNDTFDVGVSNITTLSYTIYNRWGTKVSNNQYAIEEGKTYASLWDGTSTGGISCSSGVYYYLIIATDKEGKTIEKKGVVELIR